MKMEKKILDFIKSKKNKLEIFGLRGLVKTGENEWSFRFIFRDGDFLGLSDTIKVNIDGIGLNTVIVAKKTLKNKKTNYVRTK